MSFLRTVKEVLVLIVLLILQLELFASIRLFGVMPEIMLGAAVAAGWHGGPTDGAVIGFLSGFLVDLYLASPMGLSALTYALIGYLIGMISELIAEDVERIVRTVISLVGIVLGLVTFVLFGELIAEPNLYNKNFGKILVVGGLYTGLFIPVLHFLMEWVFHQSSYRNNQIPMNRMQRN
ncbi:MAG: rod shape-determining protein MreD [Acidimicrobiaceae bacterium]|nr:rod shape-determining protein MreD [Acidimicrobiaceae bacterium]